MPGSPCSDRVLEPDRPVVHQLQHRAESAAQFRFCVARLSLSGHPALQSTRLGCPLWPTTSRCMTSTCDLYYHIHLRAAPRASSPWRCYIKEWRFPRQGNRFPLCRPAGSTHDTSDLL